MEPIPLKDIAVAVLGASAALAAVLLVFIGLLFTRADGLPADAPDRIGRKYRRTAAWGMLPVGVCVVVILASFEWLFRQDSNILWGLWRVGFWGEMIAFFGFSVISVRLLAK